MTESYQLMGTQQVTSWRLFFAETTGGASDADAGPEMGLQLGQAATPFTEGPNGRKE